MKIFCILVSVFFLIRALMVKGENTYNYHLLSTIAFAASFL